MVTTASEQWQHGIFLGAGIFLLYEIWRGWKLGAVRGLLRLTALFCAWIGGTAAAGATGTAIAFFSKVPPLIAPAVAGLTVAIGIYIIISLLAGLLFKTTENHAGVVRLGFGLGGAVCGILYGILLLWGGITLIRGLGALGELRVVMARQEGRPETSERTSLLLIRLKESLELGVTGRTLKNADPLPTAFYDDIVKISMVAGDQQALERFTQYPKTLEILANPRVLAILQDPALERASQSRNILPLLGNRHVQAAASDPLLLAQLKAFDLASALDFALQPEVKAQTGKIRPAASPNSPHATGHGKNAPARPSATPSIQKP